MPRARSTLVFALAVVALSGCGPEVESVYEDDLTDGRVVVDEVGSCAEVRGGVLVGYHRERVAVVMEEIEYQQATGRRNFALLNAPSKFDTIPNLAPGDDRTACVAVTLAEGGGAIYGVKAFGRRFSPLD